MLRYVEMGYNEPEAQAAADLHGDDLHSGCHWLMLRQTMGKMPKRLKATHSTSEHTYLESTVRYEDVQWRVDDFDAAHALILICSSLTSRRCWVHMSDSRIEWVVIRHEIQSGVVPKPSWSRKLGSINMEVTSLEEDRRNALPDMLKSLVNHGTASTTNEHYKLCMLRALTKRFVHQPSRPKPRPAGADDLHRFRIELMTYFHAVCEVCNVDKAMFNETLYNDTTANTVSLFPTSERDELEKKLLVWKKPRPFLLREAAQWRKECVPLVIFKPTLLMGDPVTTCVFDVIIHDLTFVRPEAYEVSMNVLHFQCLFDNLFSPSPIAHQGRIDDNFLNKVLKSARKTLTKGTTPSSTFVQQLFPFQTKCLTWLMARENTSEPTSSWGWTRRQMDDGFVYYTSCFGYITQSSPNNTIRGGLLCQSVGMGKTVEMLALIATNPTEGPTLIVVPTTMLTVWMAEAAKYCPSLKVVRFHGARRSKISMDELKASDIVVTTYRICVNETQRHVPTIGSIRWGRLILDESHELKSPTSAIVRAMCRLYAPLKWCLSATPFPKGLSNVASMLSFMGVTPFVDAITPSLDHNSTALHQLFRRHEHSCTPTRLALLLNEMTFWQQKRHVRLGLPGITHVVETVKMSPPLVYQTLCVAISRRLAHDTDQSHRHQKARTLHYMRWLRLASTHYALNPMFVYALIQNTTRAVSTTNSISDFIDSLGTTQYDDSLRQLVESWLKGNETCSICRDALERPTLTPCQHMFCYECIQSAYEHDATQRCPLCRQTANGSALRELKLALDTPVTLQEQEWTSFDNRGRPVSLPMEIYQTITTVQISPKVQKILDLIQQPHKIVIFTRYHAVLQLLSTVFTNLGITFVSIEGRMTPNQRAKNINSFQTSPEVRLFIMTTKTASVGITLTAGSQIIFMEPCQDKHVEKQAIGRLWRIGQTQPVTITTLTTENTFESKKPEDFLRHLNSMNAPG